MRIFLVFMLFFSCATNSKIQKESLLKSTKIAPNIYTLTGKGGNIAVITSKNKTLMIDDKFAALTENINKEISKFTKNPVGIILNTHWHGDHTGGNENYGKKGAIIVAHENVRKSLAKGHHYKLREKIVAPAPAEALPIITFKREMSFYLDQEILNVFHVKNAHTDGDIIIHFPKSNVFHMGDTFFNGFYPYIDADKGGSIKGMIKAGERVLKMSNKKTVIIPGHGPIASKADLKNYVKMLKGVRKIMKRYIKKGLSLDNILKKRPISHLEKKWGKGYFKADFFLKFVYHGMLAR